MTRPDDAYCPCDVCGQHPDENRCICPECLVCGAYGDPYCYSEHGLVRSFAQVALREQALEYYAWVDRQAELWDEEVDR